MQAQEVARRISSAVAGEAYAKVIYQVPITNTYPSDYIYLPLVFLSPTSPLPFYSPFFRRVFIVRLLCACLSLWLAPYPLLCLPSLKYFTSSKGKEKT